MSTERDTFRRPGDLMFAAVMLVLAVVLLSQLGSETKFSARGKLFSQPAFWPGVGVIGMCTFGLFWVISLARQGGSSGGLIEANVWVRSLEYLGWFMVYVFAVPYAGYLLSTLIFCTALAWRAGYRSGPTLGLAALTGLGVVLVFKTMLSVKIPGGVIYEYLPGTLRTFAIVNL